MRRVKKGPPTQYRWRAWLAVLGVRDIDKSLYHDLQPPPAHVVEQISKDVGRTFPNEPFFAEPASDGKERL
jgi:hypothetical protein